MKTKIIGGIHNKSKNYFFLKFVDKDKIEKKTIFSQKSLDYFGEYFPDLKDFKVNNLSDIQKFVKLYPYMEVVKIHKGDKHYKINSDVEMFRIIDLYKE